MRAASLPRSPIDQVLRWASVMSAYSVMFGDATAGPPRPSSPERANLAAAVARTGHDLRHDRGLPTNESLPARVRHERAPGSNRASARARAGFPLEPEQGF